MVRLSPLPGRALAPLVLVGALAACKHEPAAPPLTSDDWNRGAAVVAEAKTDLQRTLLRAMVAGPASAVEACSTAAPAITGKFRERGVTVGRATRKPRNPSNAVQGWQTEALAQFEADVAAGRRVETSRFLKRLPDGRLGYAEPLVIQPVCMACHGRELAPEVSAALAERYPTDQATGYQVGELRGLFWAELPGKGS